MLDYLADEIIIDKVAKLDLVFYKEAGVVQDLLSGAQGVVSSFVNKHIDRSSTGSFLKSVLDILAPGMFFKAHPLLGLILSVSTEFGFSASAILERIVSVIKHKILSGNQIDPAEINSAAGVNIVQAMQVLHEIDKKGELLKTAQGYKTRTKLFNLFGFMNSKRKGGALALAIGFIVWFIKTVLLSVGLLAGVGAIKKVIIPEKDKQEELGSSDEIGENMYKPEYRQNNQPVYNVKYVPLVQNSPEKTLLEWVTGFYPNLSGYDDIITKVPGFQNALNILKSKHEKGKSYVEFPKNLTEKSIADAIAPEVLLQIKKENNEA